MYHYTSNSMSSFNKGSFHSLPDTYYPSSQQQQQQQQSYGWYSQQLPMAATSAPVLAHPPSSSNTPPGTASSTSANTTSTTTNTPPSPPHLNPSHPNHRPKITTSLWEDEGTICYQVDARGICVARRQDNDMINGTKLLNVTGMSRGKRDGILKNEKGRVVVKVGAMHLKGVWVTFSRAKALAIQHNIKDVLQPLFVDDPSIYFYSNPMAPPHANYFIPTNHQQQQQQQPMYLASGTTDTAPMDDIVYSAHRHQQQPVDHLPATHAVVPSMGNLDYYAYRNNSHMSNISSSTSSSSNNPSLQDLASHSVDQLDQHSLLDYASKASSSMFSLPVSDSSPATPSQQSLFYNDSMDQLQQHQQQQYYQPSSYYQSSSQPQKSRETPPMLDLPIAPTLPSNTSLDSSFYYTHPCVSTASFHEPVSSSSPFLSSQQQQHDHQATLEFYGSYTPSSSQQQQHQYSAQPW